LTIHNTFLAKFVAFQTVILKIGFNDEEIIFQKAPFE
jgi:hypothetical protein